MTAQLDLFAPAVSLPAPVAPLRTIYPGCGADALRLYLDFTRENKRRNRLGKRAAAAAEIATRRTRHQRADEALLLIDLEMTLWPTKCLPFVEHNAQLLAELYAEHGEREAVA